MFLGTLEASLLGNMLAGTGRAGSGNKKVKGILRVSYGNEAASSLKEL